MDEDVTVGGAMDWLLSTLGGVNLYAARYAQLYDLPTRCCPISWSLCQSILWISRSHLRGPIFGPPGG